MSEFKSRAVLQTPLVFGSFRVEREIEPEPSEGALYSRFMPQSLREGGGAISKFYICRAYKLCPAIWQSGAAVAREAHNLEVAGSSPASATMIDQPEMGKSLE